METQGSMVGDGEEPGDAGCVEHEHGQRVDAHAHTCRCGRVISPHVDGVSTIPSAVR